MSAFFSAFSRAGNSRCRVICSASRTTNRWVLFVLERPIVNDHVIAVIDVYASFF